MAGTILEQLQQACEMFPARQRQLHEYIIQYFNSDIAQQILFQPMKVKSIDGLCFHDANKISVDAV